MIRAVTRNENSWFRVRGGRDQSAACAFCNWNLVVCHIACFHCIEWVLFEWRASLYQMFLFRGWVARNRLLLAEILFLAQVNESERFLQSCLDVLFFVCFPL